MPEKAPPFFPSVGLLKAAGEYQDREVEFVALVDEMIDIRNASKRLQNLSGYIFNEKSFHFYMFYKLLEANIHMWKMTHLKETHNLHIGGRDGTLRIRNLIPFDPRVHTVFVDSDERYPEPGGKIEVARSEIDVRVGQRVIQLKEAELVPNYEPVEVVVFPKQKRKNRYVKRK